MRLTDRQGKLLIPIAASGLAGLIVCLGISLATGRDEAWDSPVYFQVGIPIMVAAIGAISYFFPVHAWRWTLSMAVGQAIAISTAGGSLSLWPFLLIGMTIVSIPQFIVGFAASWAAKHDSPH